MSFGHEQNAIVGYRPQPLAMPMPQPQYPQMQPDAPEAGLLQILWRRKWTVLLMIAIALLGGFIYLKKATPIYTATAKLVIDQQSSQVIGNTNNNTLGDGYLYAQAERIKSIPILEDAAQLPQLQDQHLFAGKKKVPFLRENLTTEVGRRDGVISVSIEAAIPEEAAATVNGVIEAYMNSYKQKSVGFATEVVRILSQQREAQDQKRIELEAKLNEFREKNPGISLAGVVGNQEVTTLSRLSDALTTARLESIRTGAAYQANDTAINRRAWENAKAIEGELSSEVERQQKKAYSVNDKAQEFASLDGDYRRAVQTVQKLDDSIQQAKIDVTIADSVAKVSVLEGAQDWGLPYSPTKGRVLAVAGAVGLLLGIGLGMLRDWADQRLRSAEEVMATLGVPVLGTIPHMSRRLTPTQRGQRVFLDPMSNVAEAFRTVRTAVYFGARSDRAKTLLVTSAEPGDGKSTAAANLAIAMAQAGQRTLMLDCDFRKPTQQKIFEVPDEVGVSTVLAGREPLERAIQRTAVEGLDLLPGGPIPLNPSEILNSQAFSDMVDELAVKYDHIIIDSPPVNVVTDARILGALCDITLMVLRAEKTTRKHAEYARDGLLSVGARVLGAIVNDVSRGKSRTGFYSGYGYYGQASAAVSIAGGVQGRAMVPARRVRGQHEDIDSGD